MTILQALKKGWKRSGLTYREFGVRMGITESSMNRKLNGKQVVTLKEAEKFAKSLGVKISATLKRGR